MNGMPPLYEPYGPVVEEIAEQYRSEDKGDALDRTVARHVVADVLNAAIQAGYVVAEYPQSLRKMRIDPGEIVVLYECAATHEQLVAMQAAMRQIGAPPDTMVIALPPGQTIGLLSDAELASAGLARLSRLIISP
jgi:hypothetical protein